MGSADLLYLPTPPSRLGKLAQEWQGKKWSRICNLFVNR